MEVSAVRNDSANISAKAKISKRYIERKIDKIAKDLAKTMDIPGFRKGKVPISIVKSRYAKKLTENAHSEAVKDAYEKVLEDLGIEASAIVGEPRVPEFEELEGGLVIEIRCDLRPTVDLDGYKEIIPEISKAEVSEVEVTNRVNELLKSVSILKKVKDRDVLEDGDFALIDFEGSVNGKAFEDGKGEAYTLEIGSGSFIPGFEDQLIGMKIDEEREITVTFPAEYDSKELAGKEAMFRVKLLEIHVRETPTELTNEIAKKFFPQEENVNVEMLNERVREQLEKEKMDKLFTEEIKPKYIDALIEKFVFDIPDGIVEQEINMAFKNALSSLKEDELKVYSDKEKVKEKKAELREDAQKSVKLTFLVDELARLEEITAQDGEVRERIIYEAYQMQQEPQKYLEEYEKQGLLPAVKMAIIENKLFL